MLSSIGTWSHTASSASSPLTCSQYPSRVPSPYHQEHKRLEDYALSLRSPGLQVNVLCPGVLYGQGEEDMYMTFRDAWQYQNTPVLVPSLTEGGGKNTLPTCHVKDLGNAVKAVAETDSSLLDPYILLVDEERCTLEEIVRSGELASVQGAKRRESGGRQCSLPNTFRTPRRCAAVDYPLRLPS